jgi:hypothetical protein
MTNPIMKRRSKKPTSKPSIHDWWPWAALTLTFSFAATITFSPQIRDLFSNLHLLNNFLNNWFNVQIHFPQSPSPAPTQPSVTIIDQSIHQTHNQQTTIYNDNSTYELNLSYSPIFNKAVVTIERSPSSSYGPPSPSSPNVTTQIRVVNGWGPLRSTRLPEPPIVNLGTTIAKSFPILPNIQVELRPLPTRSQAHPSSSRLNREPQPSLLDQKVERPDSNESPVYSTGESMTEPPEVIAYVALAMFGSGIGLRGKYWEKKSESL